MATEYKLTDKNLNNITIRRKQIISRFSASSLKYVRVLKQDILNKFRSPNKMLHLKNKNLDFFKKPIKSKFNPRMVYKYPKWFQFKLVFRPNLLSNNFVYSLYNRTQKTRNFVSTNLNKSFNMVPFLTLSKLNKNSNKHFLLLQSKDYSRSLRIHNFQDNNWKTLSIIQSLNTLAGFSADYRRRDLESFTGLSIYNKLGFFKWFFINTFQSVTYFNQRFMSIAINCSSYKISIDTASRCFFLIQKVIIFEKCKELQSFNVIKSLIREQIYILQKYYKYRAYLNFLKKKKSNIISFLSFLKNFRGFFSHVRKIRHIFNHIAKLNYDKSNPLYFGFCFNKFFSFLKKNELLILKMLTSNHFKKLFSLLELKRSYMDFGLTSTSLKFQKAVYVKIWYKKILKFYRELSLQVFLEKKRLQIIRFQKYKKKFKK